MKKILNIALAGCCFLYITATDAGAKGRSVNWEDELNLSAQQKQQYNEITAQSRTKIKSLMTQIDSLHKQISELQNEDEQKLRTILNEKQQIKFDKLQMRRNKNQKDAPKDKKEKKPSRKRMRQY